MDCYFSSVLLLSQVVQAAVVFSIAAILLITPLLYRVFKGEKFGWFTDPKSKRPTSEQWQEFRDKADKIIAGNLEVAADDLLKMIMETKIEVNYYKCEQTIQSEQDKERITKLLEIYEKSPRIEPFGSLVEWLQKDGLNEEANRLNNLMRGKVIQPGYDIKKQFLKEIKKIKKEKRHLLSSKTLSWMKESTKALKMNPWITLYVAIGIFIFGLGLRFYKSIIQEKGYRFYKENPVWVIILVMIIFVPSLILILKWLKFKKQP